MDKNNSVTAPAQTSRDPFHNELNQWLFDNEASFDKVILLAASMGATYSDQFREFVEDGDLEEHFQELFGCEAGIDLTDLDAVADWLTWNHKLGFLICVHMEVQEYFALPDTTYRSSPGWCRVYWFYTDRIDSGFLSRLAELRERHVAECKESSRKEMAKKKSAA